jgi:hypothetical protein
LTRLELTWDPIASSLYKSAENAFDIGFLGKTKPNLAGIYDLTLLNKVLKEKGLQSVSENSTSSISQPSPGNSTSNVHRTLNTSITSASAIWDSNKSDTNITNASNAVFNPPSKTNLTNGNSSSAIATNVTHTGNVTGIQQ